MKPAIFPLQVMDSCVNHPGAPAMMLTMRRIMNAIAESGMANES